MADTALLEKVKSLIGDICAVDPATIAEDGKLIGYGLDSVRALDLILALEDEVGAELSEHDPELAQVHTVRQLCEFVDRRRSGG